MPTILHCPNCNMPYSPGTKFCSECGTILPQPENKDPYVGQLIGDRFLVREKLGEGGMGVVYLAEQVTIKRLVALKVLHTHLSHEQELVERFHNEASACSKLNHPNTITIYDFGQTKDGALYIAIEYIPGTSLEKEIKTKGHIASLRTMDIVLQIASSIGDAHRVGIVHRDLKPDNIMLFERGGRPDSVKVLDFGIAKMVAFDGQSQIKKLTKTGTMFGTPQYMSPEQIKGEKIDGRTDIYALGVIMYEMLTGHLPFTAENPMAILSKHLTEIPKKFFQMVPNINIPPQLEAIVFKCLEKDINIRYQSMEDISRELEMLLNKTAPGYGSVTMPPEKFANIKNNNFPFSQSSGSLSTPVIPSSTSGQQPSSSPIPVLTPQNIGQNPPIVTPLPSSTPVSQKIPQTISTPKSTPVPNLPATTPPQPYQSSPTFTPSITPSKINTGGYQNKSSSGLKIFALIFIFLLISSGVVVTLYYFFFNKTDNIIQQTTTPINNNQSNQINQNNQINQINQNNPNNQTNKTINTAQQTNQNLVGPLNGNNNPQQIDINKVQLPPDNNQAIKQSDSPTPPVWIFTLTNKSKQNITKGIATLIEQNENVFQSCLDSYILTPTKGDIIFSYSLGKKNKGQPRDLRLKEKSLKIDGLWPCIQGVVNGLSYPDTKNKEIDIVVKLVIDKADTSSKCDIFLNSYNRDDFSYDPKPITRGW